jgi:hypothetical protein
VTSPRGANRTLREVGANREFRTGTDRPLLREAAPEVDGHVTGRVRRDDDLGAAGGVIEVARPEAP